MPQLEIGPFTSEILNESTGGKETVRFLRVAFYAGVTEMLESGDLILGDHVGKVATLLKHAEDRLTDLLMAMRQGEVGFEEVDGKLARITFCYPDFEKPKGSGKPS